MSRRGRLWFLAACLGNVEQLRERFNHDKGQPRLVLALAPT